MLKKKEEKKTKHKKSKLIRFVIPIDISTTFLLIICVGKGETGIETVSHGSLLIYGLDTVSKCSTFTCHIYKRDLSV